MPYVLALDQGTSSSRAVVFTRDGTPLAIAQREFAQIFPRDGWVEHDPLEIWSSQVDTAREALLSARIGARDVVAIGIANQRETTVLWERISGKPVGNAIVWQDRRTADACKRIRAQGVTSEVTRKTGLPIDPYFSATKIAWMLDDVPGLRSRAERGEIAFGTIDAWLVWNLTGGKVHATDRTNASRTLLFDLESGDWDDALLELFGVPRAVLPELRDSSDAYGASDASVFGADIPIRGVAGDQQAALFGQAGFREGIAKCTYGTGSFVVLHTGSRIVRSEGLLATMACSTRGRAPTYAEEGSIFATGAAVQWLRDGLGLIASSRDVEALASSVQDSGGVYFVPALTGLGAPYWDPHARGAIFGISRGTTGAHIARATLDAMAHQTADVIDAMQHDVRELRVDGGAARDDLAMQLQADILGIAVVRPRVTETTALGAAFLAGLDVGFWGDLDEIERLWSVERRFVPSIDDARRGHLRAGWRNAVARTRSRTAR